ncbi:DinB family protein [Oerskovia sp. NPDC060338]|uniref:DinB family protein n=1 Tax=Oerskovia sp. NPDC060338 TaxID=3347100 RepID=UPI003666A216
MDEATHDRELIEPPVAGDEVATLLGSLERQRATFAWKVGGLDAEDLGVRVASSAITLGGLLKHLAFAEELWFSTMLHGRAPGEPWDTVDWDLSPEWPWTSAAHDSPQYLYELWRTAVVQARAAVDEALADGGLDRRLVWQPGNDGERSSLRRVLVDLIEEYARHVGHADLIRESIDGLVGEDPPGAPELYPPR